MARGNSKAQSELPSGVESEIRRTERFSPKIDAGPKGLALDKKSEEFYGFTVNRLREVEHYAAQEEQVGYQLHSGDNQIGVGSTLTDEQLDEKGVKDPIIRALFKDAEAMKRIGQAFSDHETSERAWEGGDYESDYAWNGERDVDLGSSPTTMTGGTDMIEGSDDAKTFKYQGKLIEYGPQGEIDLSGEDRDYGDYSVDLRDYDLGVYAVASGPAIVRAYESGNTNGVIDLDTPPPTPKKK